MRRHASVALVAILLAMAADVAAQTPQASPSAAGTQQAAQQPAQQAPANITLTMQMIPRDVIDRRHTQLLVTVDTSQELRDARIDLVLPPAFQVDRQYCSWAVIPRSAVCSSALRWDGTDALPGERPLIAKLSVPVPGNPGTGQSSDKSPQAGPLAVSRKDIAIQRLAFEYKPEIHLPMFLALGLTGVGLGYAIRLLIEALKAVSAAEAVAIATRTVATFTIGAPATLKNFVKDNYYWVDFLVTLGLGFVVLITLVQGGRPPQSGAAWYGALAVGFGIGLLTNSELLTRLKPR